MRILDNLENVDHFNYSVDIKKLIDAGKLNKSKFYTYVGRMLDGDFGSLDTETGYRFLKSIEKGDRDIYGVYPDAVIYYDARTDEIDVVTPEEFTRFFKADWKNPNRGIKEARLSSKQPDQQWKEGQRREIIKEVSKTVPTTGRQAVIRMGGDGKGTYPYMDYTHIAKLLGPDRLNTFRRLANEHNIPIKKLFAAFGHQHSVQNLNTQNAFNFVVNHVGDPYFAATDSIDDIESIHDADSKDDAVKEIESIVENNITTDFEGGEYLSTIAYNKIKALIKERGLTYEDLKNTRHAYFFTPGFYGRIFDSKTKDDIDLQYLIDDEFEAIAGYKAMIAKTKNPALLAILTHILEEETEHVEELRNAQAGKYEESKDSE